MDWTDCLPIPNATTWGMFNCQEENIITVFGIFAKYFKEGFRVTKLKELLMALLRLLLPLPILIFRQQVISIFSTNAYMEWLSTLFLFGEGSL